MLLRLNQFMKYSLLLCVFDSLEYVKMFLNFLNNLHSNLKFSYEI